MVLNIVHQTRSWLIESKPLLPLALLALVIGFIFLLFRVTHYGLRNTKYTSLPSSEKEVHPVVKPGTFAVPGVWVPSNFKRPDPSPYVGWSIEETKPIPYRPFRNGPKFFVTMGLRKENWEDLVELDNHFPRYHADKARRIEERGDKCCKTAPEAYVAAVELLEELCDYLPKRYPNLYKKTDAGIENLWSGEIFDIKARPLPEDPMRTCGRLIQDDISLLIQREDGQYYFLAGCVLVAGFWRLEDKFGMSLGEVHTSGDVPQYKEKLEKGILNFMRRLKPEELYTRNTYFIQVDEEVTWSYSIGNEDSPTVSWDTAQKNKAIKHHHFRAERQILRRLPKSGAILFQVRTYFHPITEIADEPYIPGRLASAIRGWGDDIAHYKGRQKYGEVLLEYLDKKHREQLDQGLVLEDEEKLRKFPF